MAAFVIARCKKGRLSEWLSPSRAGDAADIYGVT